MKLHTHLLSLVILMAALSSGWCGNRAPSSTPPLTPVQSLTPAAPARLQVQTEEEVTFYPTYGYRAGANWNAQLCGSGP